jgi:hypothetical protein
MSASRGPLLSHRARYTVSLVKLIHLTRYEQPPLRLLLILKFIFHLTLCCPPLPLPPRPLSHLPLRLKINRVRLHLPSASPLPSSLPCCRPHYARSNATSCPWTGSADTCPSPSPSPGKIRKTMGGRVERPWVTQAGPSLLLRGLANGATLRIINSNFPSSCLLSSLTA